MVAPWLSSEERGRLSFLAWEHTAAAASNQGSSFHLGFVEAVCSQPFALKLAGAAAGRDTASVYINTRNIEEVFDQINKLDVSKCPGLDGMHARGLHELECEIAELLARVCCIIAKGCCTKDWKVARLCLSREGNRKGVLETNKSDLHP